MATRTSLPEYDLHNQELPGASPDSSVHNTQLAGEVVPFPIGKAEFNLNKRSSEMALDILDQATGGTTWRSKLPKVPVIPIRPGGTR